MEALMIVDYWLVVEVREYIWRLTTPASGKSQCDGPGALHK